MIPIVDFTIADRTAMFLLNCDRRLRSDCNKKIADCSCFGILLLLRQSCHENPNVEQINIEKLILFQRCDDKDMIYTAQQKNESTLLHTYVLNEFLTADHSCTAKYL